MVAYDFLDQNFLNSSEKRVELLLHKAIEQNEEDAEFCLGLLYIMQCKATKAMELLVRAYNNGSAEAADKIAELYESGYLTGKREKNKAREWRKCAAELR